MDLPIEFKTKMINLLGSDAEKFFLSLDNPSIKSITVNFDRLSEEKFHKLADFPHSPIEQVSNGYYVEQLKISKNILSHAGVIYSQEPSAMYPIEMLDISPSDYVLDLCASPGGKSIQILEKLQGQGVLVSNEIVYNRAKVLYENLTKTGYTNFAITNNSPADFEYTNLKFDKIIVDAPCGGEGMFRKNNFDFQAYKQINVETNSKRQLSILNSTKNLLKKGGYMVYSTCTYDLQENEQVIANFLEANPNFEIIQVDRFKDVAFSGIKIPPYHTDYSYRRYPHLFKGEGQFMALLKKLDGDDIIDSDFRANNFSKISNKDKNTIMSSFKNVADLDNLNIFKRNDTYYSIGDINLDFGNLNLLSIGCVIGTINNSILKINHNCYHCLDKIFKHRINLDQSQALQYLQGLEIDVEMDNCICVVCYEDMSLGGGKVVNNRLKNYYPKELRITN